MLLELPLLFTLAGAAIAIPRAIAGQTTSTDLSEIFCPFENLQQTDVVTESNTPCAVHFDQFAGARKAILFQLLTYNGDAGAFFARDNEIRTDVSTVKYKSMDPQSVFVGCFLNRNIGNTVDTIPDPSSLPLLGQLISAIRRLLQNQAGTASNPVACKVTVRITGMETSNGKSGDARLKELRVAKKDTIDCPFVPNGNPPDGIGLVGTNVQECNLQRPEWKGVTRLNFTRTPGTTVDLGEESAGSVVGLIDDFKATGYKRF